jgi:hypothetical protein
MDLKLITAEVNKLFDELDFELSVLNLNLKVIAEDIALIEQKLSDIAAKKYDGIEERGNDNE